MFAGIAQQTVLNLNEGFNQITVDAYIPGSPFIFNIWMLLSHTHQFGTDFDIYLRHPDGSRGEQIYEGFYNNDYTFNQGFYDWAHPPMRLFEPPLEVRANYGFIYEAKWDVTQATPVIWGLTSEDEMMLFTYLYTRTMLPEEPTDTEGVVREPVFQIFPNPIFHEAEISFFLKEASDVSLELFNSSGQKLAHISKKFWNSGTKVFSIDKDNLGMSIGIYFLRLKIDDETYTKRVIVAG